MGYRHTYRLVRETKTKVLNVSTSLILVAMSLGGVLPTLFTGTTYAAGTTMYVNTATGSNVHNCTDVANPCRTIGKAIANATAGDTIMVAAGTYNEDVIVNKAITLAGAGAGTTNIVATSENTTPLTFSTSGATVSGFTIEHAYSTAEQTAWNFNNNGVFFAQGTHGNTLKDSTVTLNRNGIYLNNNTSATITGNTITDNRTGINLTNDVDGTVISGNTISHNWTVGLVYYSQGYPTNFSHVTVANNTFTKNWYEEVEVKNTGASTGTLDLTSDTFNDNGPFWYSTSSDPSQNEPGWPVPHPTELGGTDTMPASGYPTIRIYNSPTVSIDYTAVPPDTSSVTFVGSPKYVRINNAGDLDAQLVAPTWVGGVQFFIDGSGSPITGNNVGGADANTDWWRLYAPLSAGTHTITAKVELGGNWYDVADTGTVYALGNPAGDFVSPSSNGQYFRPSDNPLRISADDTNDSFADVVFHVNGKDYLVTRSQCDLREAGNRVLCDANKAVANASRHTDTWSDLSEGSYTATATIYNQARNHIEATSLSFNIDGTPPKVLSAKITSPNQTVYKNSVVVAQYIQEANQLDGATIYFTQPRNDGQCDPNESKALGPISSHLINHNGDKWYYLTTVDTSSLNGEYCIFSGAEDGAMNHNNPQEAKFSATFDNTAPVATIDGTDPSGKTFDGSTNISVHVIDANYLQTDIYRAGSTFHQTYYGPGTYFGLFWLKNGNYTMAVTDKAGNSTTYDFTIERGNPTITFVNPARFNDASYNQYFNNIGSVQIHATGDNRPIASTVVHIYNADGSYSSAWCGTAVAGDTANCDASGLVPGNYYVKVAATDANGNATYITKNFTIDNTKPTIQVNLNRNGYLSNGGTTGKVQNPEIEAFDTHLTEIRITDQNGNEVTHWGNGKSSVTPGAITRKNISWLSEGTYNIYAYDAAGNVSDAFTLTIDNTAPIGTLSYSPPTLTNHNVTVTLETSEPIDQSALPGTWLKKSGTKYQKVYPQNTTQIVTLKDAVGNTSTVTVNITWIDKTAPVTPLATLADANGNSVTNGYINTKDFTFTLTNPASDGVDHYQLKYWNDIAGSQFNGEANAWNPSNLSGYSSSLGVYNDQFTQGEGTHYFAFSACDAAGNCSAYSSPFQIFYDATAPGQISNLAPKVSGGNVSWTWDPATDSGSGIAGYLFDLTDANGNHVANFPTATADNTLAKSLPLPDGTYTFSVWAKDNAGNESAVTTDTVVVDTIAPNVQIISKGQNGNIIQPTISVDGNTVPTSGYTYKWDSHAGVDVSNNSALNPTFTVNTDGTYTFNLTVTDLAGNATTVPLTFTYNLPSQTGNGNSDGGFSNVTTSNGNGNTPVTDNGAGTATPQVLGTNNGQVKGDSVTLSNNHDQTNKSSKNSNFLGLGWWWLVVAAIAVFLWFIFVRSGSNEQA